ncbi:MAG: hypothetical protein JXN60_03800 [Lentisphaerae bacterium]|nr:hypothetical protein [Lentisphaerota bacterium]
MRTVSLGAIFRLLRWPFVLLSVTIIPRIMGDFMYGRYAFFSSVYLLADMLTDVSIIQIFGRFVPGDESDEHHEHRRQLLAGVLVFGIVLTVTLATILSLVVYIHPFDSLPNIWLGPLCILLFVTRIESVLFSFLYGLNHIARYSSRDVLRSMFSFVNVVIFYSLFGLIGAIWAMVLREIVLTIIVIPWVKDYLLPRRFLPWSDMKKYLVFGFQFYVPILLFGILQRSGNVFIQFITDSPESVGHFDIASQFSLMSLNFLGLILMTLLPSMTKLHVDNEQETIHRWHGSVLTYCGVIIALVFNMLVWLGKPSIEICLGSDFAPTYSVVLVMVLAMAPGLVCYMGMNYAILEKKPNAYTSGVTFGIIGMALVCLILIPHIGAIGAGWATLVGYFILAMFFTARYRRHLLTTIANFVKPLLIGACFVIGLAFDVRLRNAILLFAISSVLYLTVLSALHIIKWSELTRIVESVFRQARHNSPSQQIKTFVSNGQT